MGMEHKVLSYYISVNNCYMISMRKIFKAVFLVNVSIKISLKHNRVTHSRISNHFESESLETRIQKVNLFRIVGTKMIILIKKILQTKQPNFFLVLLCRCKSCSFLTRTRSAFYSSFYFIVMRYKHLS